MIEINEKYKEKNDLLVVHLQKQLDTANCWRVIVPESLDIKNEILTECHAVPYSAHPGVQRTLNNKVRQFLYWKGQSGDVRTFVDSCKICQTEKSDHSLSKGNYKVLFFCPEMERS